MPGFGDPGKSDFKQHRQTGESRREYTATQSSLKARNNDGAGKPPTYADEAAHCMVRKHP